MMRRLRDRFCSPSVVALVLLAAGPLAAQFGAIGLSGVGARRFENVDVGPFEPHTGDLFGEALVAGDFNGDGLDDLATGAPNHTNAGATLPDSGAVFVHYSLPGLGLAGGGAGQAVSQAAAGNPDEAEAGDGFGRALASCDFDGDGRDDLAVGIPGESLGTASRAGAVEIRYGSFSGLGAVADQFLNQDSGSIPGDSEGADFFGAALACGRFDGDAFADLAIAAWDENLGPAEEIFGAGTVVVLRGSASGLLTSGVLLLHQDVAGMDDAADSFDYFGVSLAAGDFDGDAFDDLAIGVPGEDNPVSDTEGRGAIHVVFGGPGGLTPADDFFKTESALGGNSEIGDHFGNALAAGDFDGDGFDDLAIGAPDEDLFPFVDAGQVVAIYGSAAGFVVARTQFWTEDAIHGSGASEDGDRFGAALASGDFDGDGRDDLAIGQPEERILEPRDGQVSVIMGAPGGLSNARRHGLVAGYHGNPGVADQANRNFGDALTSGDFDGDGFSDLVVGAPREDERFADVGAEIVYYGSLFSDGFEVGDTGFWSSDEP